MKRFKNSTDVVATEQHVKSTLCFCGKKNLPHKKKLLRCLTASTGQYLWRGGTVTESIPLEHLCVYVYVI